MRRATLAVCLSIVAVSSGRRAAAEPLPIAFDTFSPGVAQILSGIKSDLAAHPEQVPAVGAVKAIRPVVVTVSGMEMAKIGIGIEYGYILKVWHWLFPDDKPDEEAIAERLKELYAEAGSVETQAARKPENYLELDIKKAAEKNGLDLAVVNFRWSRDPKETAPTIESFEKDLLAVRDGEDTRGRPLYIVAHSWGTVLIHEALVRLERRGEPIQVQHLVTLGSPLVPHRLFVRLFKRYHDRVDRLQRRIRSAARAGRRESSYGCSATPTATRWSSCWAATTRAPTPRLGARTRRSPLPGAGSPTGVGDTLAPVVLDP